MRRAINNLSVKAKFTIVLVSVITLAAAAVAFVRIGQMQGYQEEELTNLLRDNAYMTTSVFNTASTYTARLAEAAADIPHSRRTNLQALFSSMNHFHEDIPLYANMLVFNADLELILAADETGPQINISLPYFTQNVSAARMGLPHVSPAVQHPETGLMQFLFTHPIMSGGSFSGIIAMPVNAHGFGYFLEGIQNTTDFIAIADSVGTIFYSNFSIYTGRNIAEFGATGYPQNTLFYHTSLISGTDAAVYITTDPISEWQVISFIDTANIPNINADIVISLVPTVGGIIIAAIFMIFVLHRSLKPLDALAIAAIEIAEGNTQVNLPVARNDEIGKVSKSFTKIIENFNFLRQDFIELEKNAQHGKTHYRVTGENSNGIFREIVDKTNGVMNDFEYTLNLITQPLITIDDQMRVMHTNNSAKELTNTLDIGWDKLVGMKINNFLNKDIAGHPATVKAFKEQIPQEAEIQIKSYSGEILDMEYNCIPFSYEGGPSGAVLLMTNITHIRNMQRRDQKRSDYQHDRTEKVTQTIVEAFEKGRLGISIPKSTFDGDTKDIAAEQDVVDAVVQKSMGIIKGYVDEITAILREISENNFDVSIDREFIGDFGSIRDSIGQITESVSALISEIQAASAGVEDGANVIAQSTQDLMASFEEQNAAMSEVTDAISILTQKTHKNAEDARSASSLTENVQTAAYEGKQYMQDLSNAMEEIKQSSTEIAKVAGIIESIAFQTNLLALNASVEAARAGEHGKGFAVVAEEVRTLAGRSAAAAKDTSEMLSKSMNRVEEGVAKSVQTADALENIAQSAAGVTEVVSDMAQLSSEQAEEISKIKHNIEAVYRGSSDSSNAVQSNASVSEELSSQASMLRSLTEQFRIKRK